MDSQTKLNMTSADLLFKSANAWQLLNKFDLAYSRYQEVLSIEPNYMPAYQQLGNLMLRQRKFEEAIEYYDKALSLNFNAVDLSFYYRCLGLPSENQRDQKKSVKPNKISFASRGSNTQSLLSGKINLGSQRIFEFHRCGWNYALSSLIPLHSDRGILFDGCLENLFLFQHSRPGKRSELILNKMKVDGVFSRLATSEEKGIVPYREPWIGFLHNPQNMPVWFQYQNSPQKLFEKSIWQESLKHCIGLFALSRYHADWIAEQTGKPASALIHPTEIPEIQFDFEAFRKNSEKKIVQIGWWLRKPNSIYRLPIPKGNALGYEKVRLGSIFENAENSWQTLLKIEAKIYRIQPEEAFWSNVRVINYLSNNGYDKLLSKNIAFVDMHDSSANNAIIECIARATPLLVNPLPAVKEYLGEDYPMYFNSLEEAAEKGMDMELILQTHQYLKECETRSKLSGEYFLKSFMESKVYNLL
jgi:tetratricopeptide (TPR) repeat protein